ncbi:hypothetical protein KFU94_30385 [Chloroflexi bacterium TSY]|nr:hypothetical protein [Chloroflexi bacterium TSY]
MKLLTIQRGCITIRLSPFQCAEIAKACRVAYEASPSGDIDHWSTLSALFHACAISGFAQQHMCPHDENSLNEQLLSVNL